MEVDLKSAEVIFAQKLTCGEPGTRQKALRTLQAWLKEQSASKVFDEADMDRLWKGLHYAMWMQDKMILQEELADKISSLFLEFSTDQEKQLFLRGHYRSMAMEFYHIDRWRMDKFLMLMRRMLRVVFSYLSGLGWKKEIRNLFWNVFKSTVVSADANIADGLKFHFASIILDEMDLAGGLTKKQVTLCLKPFVEILEQKSISEYLFSSITEEIFATILHQRSEEIAADVEPDEDSPGIKFDYMALGRSLFNVGKQPQVTAKRRKVLYELAKKFEVASKGNDPYHFEPPVAEERLTAKDIYEAAQEVIKSSEEMQRERAKYKKEKKERKAALISASKDTPPVKKTITKKSLKLKARKSLSTKSPRAGKKGGLKTKLVGKKRPVKK